MNFNLEEFNRTYKGTREFCSHAYFSLFLQDIEDETLMSQIKFANDYLQVPPVESYIKYHRDVFNKEMERSEKLNLGACFGYLYKFIYGYTARVSTWVGDKITGIKNASYFKK